MKTLYLIRHAKSSWNVSEIQDIDRPLNERGYSDAYEMASRIKKKIHKNDPEQIIISSPATRALSTALIFARQLNYDASGILIHPLLYDTNTRQYSSVIEAIPNEFNCAILFGHNPVISEVANILGGSQLGDMPTCGIVEIEFDQNSWKESLEFGGKMVFYDFPKNIVN